MADGYDGAHPCAPRKFADPDFTADGAPRARVPFMGLETLWVNTGTLCNLECAHCYIGSSPKNDRLVYLTAQELRPYLDMAQDAGAAEINFTGGEPFMNPDMVEMASAALERGFDVLILTNAMRPMRRPKIEKALLRLRSQYGRRLKLRVSIDHYTAEKHNEERASDAFDEGLAGLRWLFNEGFAVSVAGRMLWSENEADMRRGYAKLFARNDISIDAASPQDLVLFPEMDETADAPEISTACWGLLGKSPREVMCANARMLVKRKGAAAPTLLACTLIPYEDAFDMGPTLEDAARPVKLNHPHCASFCVLGGASCSG